MKNRTKGLGEGENYHNQTMTPLLRMMLPEDPSEINQGELAETDVFDEYRIDTPNGVSTYVAYSPILDRWTCIDVSKPIYIERS